MYSQNGQKLEWIPIGEVLGLQPLLNLLFRGLTTDINFQPLQIHLFAIRVLFGPLVAGHCASQELFM